MPDNQIHTTLEADGAHERQRVAVLDDAGAHPVVEHHPPVFEPILEVHVDGDAAKHRRQFGQREVVGAHQANGAQLHQRPHDPFRANPPIVRIGAVQDLVQQETAAAPGRAPSRRWCGCGGFPRRSASARPAANPRRGGLRRARAATGEADGRHRRAGQRQHDVDADRPQQRALPRHVRPADDEHAGARGWTPPSRTSFRTDAAPGISGCPSPSASNTGPAASNSGNGSAGCSYANVASADSASTSPTTRSQSATAGPYSRCQREIASATCGRTSSTYANGANMRLCAESAHATSDRSDAMRREGNTPSVMSAWQSAVRRGVLNGSRSRRASRSASSRRSWSGVSIACSTW